MAGDRLVFSDLRDDMYRCLSLRDTQVALRLFPEFQERDARESPDTTIRNPELTKDVVRQLAENGLLADNESDGKAIAPVRTPAITSSILSDAPNTRPPVRIGHRVLFLRSCVMASAKLRFQSLRRIVRSVERRSRRRRTYSSSDNTELLELVAVFHHLRPYYVREYLCRFDSLALIEFLAHYSHFPQWVFGVKGDPFRAHCWVQSGHCLLNDSIDGTNRYTPIMTF